MQLKYNMLNAWCNFVFVKYNIIFARCNVYYILKIILVSLQVCFPNHKYNKSKECQITFFELNNNFLKRIITSRKRVWVKHRCFSVVKLLDMLVCWGLLVENSIKGYHGHGLDPQFTLAPLFLWGCQYSSLMEVLLVIRS